MKSVAPAHVPLPGLDALRKRSQVRIRVPAEVQVFARLRARASGAGAWRGVVHDISSRGMAVDLIDGGSFDPPAEKEEVSADLEHEGHVTAVEGWVARVATRSVGVRFRRVAAHDDDVDTGLLALLVQLAARGLVHVERSGGRPGPEHFYGPGHLDVRIALEPPAWWQLVFLEFVVSWSEDGGLSTATTDKSFAFAADALAAESHVVRHERPWRSLCKLAVHAAVQCAAAQPRHADAFALVQRIARTGMS
jgi:hypothetical protein